MSAKKQKRNEPVQPGDRIQVVVKHTMGEWLGTIQTVKSVWEDGTPLVRYKHGKVDKPIHHWIKLPALTP